MVRFFKKFPLPVACTLPSLTLPVDLGYHNFLDVKLFFSIIKLNISVVIILFFL